MKSPRAVIGRAAELEAIEAFINGLATGPSALALEGEMGIGKTTLFRAAVDAARGRGIEVLVARPSQSEVQLAHAGLGDLLGSVPAAVLDELPSPQRKAVEVALLRSEPDDAQQLLPRAVALGLLEVLRVLARTRAVMIAIDDVQWLDIPSRTALEFVVRRVTDERIGFLTARRSDAAPSDAPLGLGGDSAFGGSRLRRRQVTPLDPSELDDLLRERSGGPLPRRMVTRLHEMSGGNPFYALEIAHAGIGRVGPSAIADSLAISPRLQDLVGHRVRELDRPARAVVDMAATLSRATVDVLTAAVPDVDVAAGLDAAVAAGVLDVEGDRVSFVHPLLRAAAYAQIPPAERDLLHARLAVLLQDPEDRGRHLALCTSAPDDVVASALDEAARRARARGAPDAAAELFEQARRLTPSTSSADAHRRGVDAAERHLEAGNTPRAEAVLADVLERASPGCDRAQAFARLGWVQAHAQGLRVAERSFRAALAEPCSEDALRIEIEQGMAWSAHSTASAAEALVHAKVAVELAERLEDPSLLAGALSYLALLESLTGKGIALATAERASGLGHTPSWSQILGRTDWVHALLLQWVGRLPEAQDRFEALHAHALAYGDEHALPAILFQLARVELLRGDWPAAHRHARECADATTRGDQVGEQPYALTIQAMIDAHLGHVDEARVAIAEGRRLADMVGVQPAGLEIRAVEGFLLLSLGDYAAASETFTVLAAAADAAGFLEPAVFRYHGDAIEVSLALGERENAAAKVADLDRLATKLDRPWVRMVAARSRALLHAATGDLDGARAALAEALELGEETGPFERARTLLALGTVQRRDKQKRAARASLAEASEIFARLGAALWVDRARAEMARVGGRASGDDLTPTERRVATLIAAGRTYREAADELFISPKTVQWNLSKVYRKLGIRSRAELPARLAAEQDPE